MDLQRVKGGGERSVPGWVSCLVQVNVQSHWGSTYSIQEHHELLVCLFAPASLVAYSVGARRNAEISWVSSVSQACSKKGQFKQRLSRKCWFVWIFFFWGGAVDNKKSSTSAWCRRLLSLIFMGKENKVNHVQNQCSSVLKTSASSFSIKLPGTVDQLGNLNPRPSRAEILWLTIISATGSWITVPGDWASVRLLQSLLAIQQGSALLSAVSHCQLRHPQCKLTEHRAELPALCSGRSGTAWQRPPTPTRTHDSHPRVPRPSIPQATF